MTLAGQNLAWFCMEEIEDYSIVVEVKQLTELAQSEEEAESMKVRYLLVK